MSTQPEAYFQGRALEAARAIVADDMQALEQALVAGALHEPAEESRMTLVLFALSLRRHSGLQTLLRWKADPNQPTALAEGWFVQPVALAAEYDDVGPLRLLLASGGDPNSRCYNEPAIFAAIQARNWPALRVLALVVTCSR